MKKNLPLIAGFFFILNSGAQTNKTIYPIQIEDKSGLKPEPIEVPFSIPVKEFKNEQVITSANKISSSAATSCTHFSGSSNILTTTNSGGKCLQYNPDVDCISFIHRAAPCYTAIPNGNSGTILSKYSTNGGTSWDSTVIWTNTTNLARYPQGGIYNPPGNTNASNAYFVGSGPTVNGTPWTGNFFASKQISFPGTTTPGADQQFIPNTSPFGSLGKKADFARNSFQFTDDGAIHVAGEIANDIANTSYPARGERGMAVLKGVFNAGAFIWSYDSLIVPTITRGDGSKQMSLEVIRMAWNDAGTVGYAVFVGGRAGTTGALKGYQPIIYKTTNSGASWTLLPANNFTTTHFQGLVNRLWVSPSAGIKIPFFSTEEGLDVTVDVNDNLHIACTVLGAYSSHNDSLGYVQIFGTEQYNFPHTGSFTYPTIYDFSTNATGWDCHIVDSMATEGAAASSGFGGYSYNQWASSTSPVAVGARIQMSVSDDRKKIFYSWSESDTVSGAKCYNVNPNIMMRGYDVTLDRYTNRVNVTSGLTSAPVANKMSYFHFMSPKTKLTSSTVNEIPFTITYNSARNGANPVNHYYLKGASFADGDFTVVPMLVGINEVNSTSTNAIDLYPNPAKDKVTISVELEKAMDISIDISDITGKKLHTFSMNGQSGTNKLNLELSDLNSGIYLYSVKTLNSVVTKKLIIE